MLRVEMRWRMIFVVHRDDDAEEAAYLWHSGLPEMEIGQKSGKVIRGAQRRR